MVISDVRQMDKMTVGEVVVMVKMVKLGFEMFKWARV